MSPTPASRAKFPWFVLCLLWAAVVFVRYFTFPSHPIGQVFPYFWKVFDTGEANAGAGSFWSIQGGSLFAFLTAGFITAMTWSIGWRVRAWVGLAPADSWVRLAFDYGFGVVFLNLFWIGAGLERIWFKPLWILGWVGGLLLLVPDLYRLTQGGKSNSPGPLFPRERSYLFLAVCGLFYWGFSFLQNLTPEVFYDSMVYHLAVPNYWLLHHGLRDFPTNFFANYPYGAETYFLNGMVLQGTEAAKMLHLVSFGICALLAGGWARELVGAHVEARALASQPRHTQSAPLGLRASGQGVGERAGWLTLGLTLTLPLFAINTWTTQVEGFLTLGVLLSIYALWHATRDDKWPLVAGLFAGLAFSSKYTAVFAVGSAVLLGVFQEGSWIRKGWRSWMPFTVGSALLLGPWILKNFCYTGNPFFPYLMDSFAGRHLPEAGYARLLEEQHARAATDALSWVLLPWNLTMSNPDSYNFCGPLALALTPLLFLFRRPHLQVKFLALLTPLLLVEGLAVTHILRFSLPVFVLLYLLAGILLAGGERPEWGRGAAWVGGVSALLCFAYLAAISHFYYSCAGIWTGRQTRADYLTSRGKITPYYPMAAWISDHLPEEAHLLVAGDARGLYYKRPFLTNSVFDTQCLAQAAREEKDAAGMARRLKEWGVDYLAVNGLEGVRVCADYHHYDMTTEEWKRLDDFIQRGTEPLYLENFQGVYRILPVLAEKPGAEKMNLLLFFSKPASDFVKHVRERKWKEAGEALDESLRLYPFSATWASQKKDFEKNTPVRTRG